MFPPDQAPPSSYEAALRGLADKPVLASRKWQEQQWRANREGANPNLLEFERVLVKKFAKLGVPMSAHTVVRTEDEQRGLFIDGHSKDSPDDGLWPHKGCAFDLVHSVKAWGLSKREWDLIGHVGKEAAKSIGVHVTWGGDWNFYDPAHWELTNWREIMEQYPWPKTT